jgi:hypothetical protein
LLATEERDSKNQARIKQNFIESIDQGKRYVLLQFVGDEFLLDIGVSCLISKIGFLSSSKLIKMPET